MGRRSCSRCENDPTLRMAGAGGGLDPMFVSADIGAIVPSWSDRGGSPRPVPPDRVKLATPMAVGLPARERSTPSVNPWGIDPMGRQDIPRRTLILAAITYCLLPSI